jgi:gliding motility-associated-like protein
MKSVCPNRIKFFNEPAVSPFYTILSILLLISTHVAGQCTNSPIVTLSAGSSSLCDLSPVIVSGNTFGGSAKRVTITENGSGSVSPTSATSSPFTFTYTPKSGDAGKKVVITVTTDNPLGSPCVESKATYTLTVNNPPSAPHAGTITNPTCVVSTGSISLSSLPSAGTWTVILNPGSVTKTGTGTSTIISDIPAGTYSFTVTNSEGCTSSALRDITIPAQPLSPVIPVHTIDCTMGYGKAVVIVTSPTGTGLQYRLDGGVFQSGTSFSNVTNENHNITVRNSSGCTTTGLSFLVSCGCSNPPAVFLSSASGSSCGNIPVTISGNTFGGSATSVTITENGAGTITPATTNSMPFAFTYTPASGDTGNTVTITVMTNNPAGSPCIAAVATYTLKVNASPPAPVVGAITQPTCSVATGSVVLSGLPSVGIWRITQSPGGIITMGTGTSAIISALPYGINNFTLTYINNCVSRSSGNVIINAQSSAPAIPVVNTITQPTCTVSTGTVLLSGLPSAGIWTLTRYPGTVALTGTGTSIIISGLEGGMYNFMITNSNGCVSGLSANVVILQSPGIPSTPMVGIITQPVYETPTGSVVLSGLPPVGVWTLTLTPGNVPTYGTGINKLVSGLATGTYSFTVTNSAGCISGSSASVVINPIQAAPKVMITKPAPVCTGSTVDLTSAEITSGSSPGLTYTYWINATATVPFNSPLTATAGTYYIKGTSSAGFFTIKQIQVTEYQIPIANAGTDQYLGYQLRTTMNPELTYEYESGVWSVISGTGVFIDASDARTFVDQLSVGENSFLWTVTNGVCPASRDTVLIYVHELVISTLLTPNMDGRNDYFILDGLSTAGKTKLIIFDRSGVQVYKNEEYDNLWDGVDYKGNPLPEDTYFCIIKTGNAKIVSGYIVIRR